MSNLYGYDDVTSEEIETIDSDEEDQKRSSRNPDKLPFSIIWRDDQTKVPCSSLLITLGATASGKTFSLI